MTAKPTDKPIDPVLAKYWYDHDTAKFRVRPGIAPLPTQAQIKALGSEAIGKYLIARKGALDNMLADPLWSGWYPPIWHLAWAIMDAPWTDPERNARIRARLGMKKCARILWILGANRGGKTEFAACTCGRFLWPQINPKKMTPATVARMKQLQSKPRNVYCFHATEKDSADRQQPLFIRYMPPPYRSMVVGLKQGYKEGNVANIKYSVKNGFSEGLFVTPDGSKCDFRNYAAFSHDAGSVEGIEADIIWADELANSELLSTLKSRIAQRDGVLVPTFTPVNGYSPAVRMADQSSTVAMDSPAFLLPEDGLEPAVESAMYTEDVIWRLIGDGPREDGHIEPAGRKFISVPRVKRCHNDGEAIVYFHGADNPFGNPRSVYERWKTAPSDQQKIRLYGLAERQTSARYAKFDRKVHVVKDSEIPKEGTNYLIVDPASARNFAMAWIRRTKDGRSYIYREWPGNYEIPGHGVPGRWTDNDARKPDGKRGDGQKKIGFGLLDYKREIARLEGWKDYKDAKAANFDVAGNKCKGVSLWVPWNGSEENVFLRIIDSRAATAPKIENDRETSLQAAFGDIGLDFELASGEDIDAGDALIDSALAYDREKPVDFFNSPTLYVAESCENTIYMFENFTGLTDAGRTDFDSACKEWSDLLRYYFLSCPVYVDKGARRCKPGGYF